VGRTVTVVTIGDSISAGTPGWDPDPSVREKHGASNPMSQWQYWAGKAHAELLFRNCGVNRERTDQITARFKACAVDAQAVVIQGGINDIVQDRPIALAARDLHGMVRQAKDAGLDVAVANVLPWNNGTPQAREKIAELNGLIGEFARTEDVVLLPFYETLENPDELGTMRLEWTVDGNHPSIEGHRRLGERAFQLTGRSTS
jgi:lysophospholipase L1-like esterase